MVHIHSIGHAQPEKAPFCINREQGYIGYTFLHFFDSVELLINNQIVVTRPHACILFAPGTKQYFKCQQDLVHDWFHFSLVEPLPKGLLCDTIYYPTDHSIISAIVRELSIEFFSCNKHHHALIHLKTTELFYKLIRSSNCERLVVPEHNQRKNFLALRTHIFTHCGEHWTVEKMAERLDMSVSHFHAMYRQLFGKSPMDDLISLRCNMAYIALQQTNEPVNAIAKRLGYNNTSHFIRQFRSIYGITPNVVRQKLANVPFWVHPLQQSNNISAIYPARQINNTNK